jgi:hypothetical protein
MNYKILVSLIIFGLISSPAHAVTLMCHFTNLTFEGRQIQANLTQTYDTASTGWQSAPATYNYKYKTGDTSIEISRQDGSATMLQHSPTEAILTGQCKKFEKPSL